MHRII